MFVIDMPSMPPQQAPIVAVAQATPSAEELYGTVGVCYLRPANPNYASVGPRDYAYSIFLDYPQSPPLVNLDYEIAIVSILSPPEHGTLGGDLSPGTDISYTPSPGYVGKDKMTFLVNIEGYKIKVIYFIEVLGDVKSDDSMLLYRKYCNPSSWRISWSENKSPATTLPTSQRVLRSHAL